MSADRPAPADTAELLEAFRAARQAPRRRPWRRLAAVVVSAFGLVSLAAIATHDRGVDAPGLAVVGGSAPSASPGGAPVAAPGGGGGSGAGGGGGTATGSGAVGGPGTPTGEGDGGPSTGARPGSPSAPRSPTPTSTPPEASQEVAVVGPLLRVFAFGSRVGLPLLCSVSASALASQVPDPAVAEVITTVVLSCLDFGSQGDEALRAMSEQLSALSAANPALNPIIEALADTFNTAGAQGVPFAESLVALGELVGFFAAPSE